MANKEASQLAASSTQELELSVCNSVRVFSSSGSRLAQKQSLSDEREKKVFYTPLMI